MLHETEIKLETETGESQFDIIKYCYIGPASGLADLDYLYFGERRGEERL